MSEGPAAAEELRLGAERQDEYVRLLPLVKWLLALPHLIVLIFLGIAALFVFIFGAVAAVFVARVPRGAFDFQVGVYRWSSRVRAYIRLMTDRYPTFSLRPDPGYPVTFEIDYPEEGIPRWRPFVSWLLIIPYAFMASVINVLGLLAVVFALFVILFTKRFPDGLFEMSLVALRWNARVAAYFLLLSRHYPRFRWD